MPSNDVGIVDIEYPTGEAVAVISVELPEQTVGLFAKPFTVSCAEQKLNKHSDTKRKYSFFMLLDFNY